MPDAPAPACAADPDDAAPAKFAADKPRLRHSRAPVLLAGAALLVAVGAGGSLLLRSPAAPPAAASVRAAAPPAASAPAPAVAAAPSPADAAPAGHEQAGHKDRLNEMIKASAEGAWPRVDAARGAIARPLATGGEHRDKARTLNEQALKAMGEGQYAAAIPILHAAIELDAADSEMRNNLGYAYLRAARLADAEKFVASSLELGPDRAAAWANLAEILAEKDNRAASRSSLRLALYYANNRKGTVEALAKASEHFTSARYRAVIADVLADVQSIPEKP